MNFISLHQRLVIFLLLFIFSTSSNWAQTTFTIGSGTSGNLSNTYPTTYSRLDRGNKMQMIYRASEMTAAGATAGTVSSVSFNVMSLNALPILNSFEIKIKNDTINDLSTEWVTGMTTVVSESNYIPFIGWNTHTFSSPFIWDGVSNIIVEICGGNSIAINNANATVQWTTGLPSGTTRVYHSANDNNVCSDTLVSLISDVRSNAQFTFSSFQCINPPFAGFASASDSTPCVNDDVTFSLDGTSSGTGLSIQWQISFDGSIWTSLSGDTTLTITKTISDTAYYRAVVYCGTGSDTSTSVFVSPVGSSMSGVYTINQNAIVSTTNYTSFQSFFDDLQCGGVSGPVTVNVVAGSGPYTEQVVASEVVGVSSVNTITINGNGNRIQHNGMGSSRSTLTLNGADWLIVDNLVIASNGSTQGSTLNMTNNADYNTFIYCEFLANTSSNSANFHNIVFAPNSSNPMQAGQTGSYNHFENNYINGGHRGVVLLGSSSSLEAGNSFVNNEIVNWYQYGFHIRNQDSLLIHGNDFNRLLRANHSFHRALNFLNHITNSRITANKIHDLNSGPNGATDNSSQQIISVASSSGNANSPNVVANNLIYNLDGTGWVNGVNISDSHHWHFYHNTFVMDFSAQSNQSVRVFYHTGSGSNIAFKNNIAYANRSPFSSIHGVYLNNASVNIGVDGNAYFFPELNRSTVHIGYFMGNHDDLSDWQAVNNGAFDQNSVHVNPMFVNLAVDSLMPQNPLLKSIGRNVLSFVDEDFVNVPRPASPDPGAYQFEAPPGADMALLDLIAPQSVCPGNVDFIANVENQLQDTVYAIRIKWRVNNVPQPSVVVQDTFVIGNTTPIILGYDSLSSSLIYNVEAEIDSIYPGVDTDTTNNSAEILNYRTGLAGAYTIDQNSAPSATNFTSFEDLSDALTAFGVCGSVEATVVTGSGPYNEQVEFGDIDGVSSVNTITINGNGNELNYLANDLSKRFTFGFNDASYITVDSLRIVALGSASNTAGWGVWISNTSTNNTVRNCEIFVDTISNSNNYAGIVMSANSANATSNSSGAQSNYNTIKNNTIKGGAYGIVFNGHSSNLAVGNIIMDNFVKDFRLTGIRMRHQDSIEVLNNEITRGNRLLSGLAIFYGIDLDGLITNSFFDGNWIHGSCNNCSNLSQTTSQMGIRFTGDGALNNESIISNNIISDINGSTGDAYGMYLNSVKHWKIYNNTIVMDNAQSNLNVGIHIHFFSGTTDIDIKNNIISVENSNELYGLNIRSMVNNLSSDYNAIYAPNGYVAHMGSNNYVTLSDWQTQGFDLNGQSASPNFVDPINKDYTPRRGAYHQQGVNLQNVVPIDFFGVQRDSTPDLGAIEFTPGSCLGSYDPQVDSVTSYSAFISWSSDETEWIVEWGAVGFTPRLGLGTELNTSNNSMYEVVGFLPQTCYDIYVAELCSGDTSIYIGPISVCTPIANDAEMKGLVTPADRNCGSANTDVEVEIRNNGFLPISQMDVTVEFTGSFTQTFNFAYSGNIQSGQSEVIVVGNADFREGGVFDVVAYVSLNDDEDLTNDTVIVENLIVIPEEPIIENLPICADHDSVVLFGRNVLKAIGYRWYNSPSTGSLISSNDTLVVPVSTLPFVWLAYDSIIRESLYDTVCVPQFTAVSSSDMIQNVSTTGGSTSNISNLNSFISPGGYGDYTNQVVDAFPGQTINFELQSGSVVPQAFKIWIDWNNDGEFSGPGEAVWDSEIATTSPITTSISVPLFASPGEKRIRIRCRRIEDPIDPCALQQRGEAEDYTLVVLGDDVCSSSRTQVDPISTSTDSSVTASFSYNVLQNLNVEFINTSSHSQTIATWSFGAMGTATGDTVQMTFPQASQFQVCMQVSNSCMSDSVCELVNVFEIGVETFAIKSLKVYPNPSDGRFNVSFFQDFVSDVSIELIDLAGKTIYTEVKENFSGKFAKTFDHSNVASGNYLLRIRNSKGLAVRKLMIK